MFTGIVEEVGTVRDIDKRAELVRLQVNAAIAARDLRPGDSIAVSGTCLTVTQSEPAGFSVEIVPETVRRTNLGRLSVGDQVNLERPLAASGRLGGHFVQGHVDGLGRVESVRPDGEALDVRIAVEADLFRYIVEKGFIALDGASLTIAAVDNDAFHISLIPYSQSHLSTNIRTEGNLVNVEVDILAKYVEKLLVD